MKFDVYCDENRPDLLSSKKSPAKYMVIGSLWLRYDDRQVFKDQIHGLRDKHKVGGEFKWQKVSHSRSEFYRELTDWFFGQGKTLRFRCIAVERDQVDLLEYHDGDQELGFYKFYYQMLHHWIRDFNEYAIFCDFKTNWRRDRVHVLRDCLRHANLSANVTTVQVTRSRESVLIQLTDVLTGVASAGMNGGLQAQSARAMLLERFETRLGHKVRHTFKSEQKFNVFEIDLQGGW